MTKTDNESGVLRREIVRTLQEALVAIEPPPASREAMLQRILDRTVRSWRAWLNRPRVRNDA